MKQTERKRRIKLWWGLTVALIYDRVVGIFQRRIK
jgi:hypothetical protein